MPRKKDRSDRDQDNESSDRLHPWIPVVVAFVPHVCAALGALRSHLASLQGPVIDTDTTRAWLTFALGFVILPCSLSWWSVVRLDAARPTGTPSGVHRWLPLIIAAALLWFVPYQLLSSAPRGASAPWLTIECEDEAVESIRYLDVELVRGPRSNGRGSQFSKQQTSVPGDVVLAVTRSGGGWSWTQYVWLHECSRGEPHVRCVLPKLDWTPAHFLSPERKDGMINQRDVLFYGPGDRCESLAGKSLAAGIRLFSSMGRRTTVTSKERGDLAALGGSQIAVVGDYDSHATALLLEACTKLGPLGCGPHLTLSSAVGLRDLAPAAKDPLDSTPRVFRLTSDNHSRARDLVMEIEREATAGGLDELFVVYNDESNGHQPKDVYYALDQARELKKELSTMPTRDKRLNGVHWYRFKHVGGEGPVQLAFSLGAPDEPAQPLEITTFQQLVQQIRASSDALKRVVFVDRDLPIVEFGHAIQTEYARTRGSREDLVWYVPGPREIVEGVWNKCFDVPRLDRDLDGVVVLGPDGPRDTGKAREFERRWHKRYPHEPVAPRAARMYDALELVETAVRELDRELLANKHYLDVHAYRRALRKQIHEHRLEGASALYAFDELGDMLALNHVGERRRSGEVELRPLPQAQDPRPATTGAPAPVSAP